MKTVNTILLGTLIAITLACGYSKPSGSGTSNMPAISNLNPTSATAGDPAFTLTVTGTNFASKATVNWNGTAQPTTPGMAGQLTIAVPASAVATSGKAQITVTNPATSSGGIYGGGTSAQTSGPMTFTIN
jgi:hypothetical protein